MIRNKWTQQNLFFKKNLLCQAINEHIAKPHARVYNGISLFTTFLYLLSPKQQKSSCLQHQLRAAVTHRVACSALEFRECTVREWDLKASGFDETEQEILSRMENFLCEWERKWWERRRSVQIVVNMRVICVGCVLECLTSLWQWPALGIPARN